MDLKKTAEECLKAGGSASLIGLGCVSKLASMGLTVADVCLSGAANLADSFTTKSSLNIGKALHGTLRKKTDEFSKFCFSKAKELIK